MRTPRVLLSAFVSLAAAYGAADESLVTLPLRVSWGQQTATARPFYLEIVGENMDLRKVVPRDFEDGDTFEGGVCRARAGGGDCDGVDVVLGYRPQAIAPSAKVDSHWLALLAASDADTVRRLENNPGYRPDARRLTLRLNAEGTRGFSLSLDQLLQARSIWIPALDVYLDAADPPRSLAEHRAALTSEGGRRVLDQIAREPEASYEQFKARWEDMGSPSYRYAFEPHHPAFRHDAPPGHIVCLGWDSAIPKFGVDRGAGVWSDYGNPNPFRVWFDFGELSRARDSWKSQRLDDGFPVIATVFEEGSVRSEIEQFACPLLGPPAERHGDIAMVLLERIRLTDVTGKPSAFTFQLHHVRKTRGAGLWSLATTDKGVALVEPKSGAVCLSIEGLSDAPTISEQRADRDGMTRTTLGACVEIPAGGTREFIVKIPSPPVAANEQSKLLAIDYDTARQATLGFWANYEARGARFVVPEKAVNELWRANLWHALRLPRRHGGQEAGVKVDLPYSNFAYEQVGTPWPVVQAAMVDYMIYDLRGYHEIAAEELGVILRNQQQPDGRVAGAANWLVYTPGILYAVAQNYLLSRNAAALDRLLPKSLCALDWCLGELKKADARTGPGRGLAYGPLNDCTGDGAWALNQAYLYAGLARFGHALERRGHPGASECLDAADKLRASIARAFHVAAARSAPVELRDHTWIPHVPCAADLRDRLFSQWYPTEVDTGAVHLLRLGAVPARGDLADWLLNDHEDNLFLDGWGVANEPVYNQTAAAYLLRDDPKAVIRTFYSMMAAGFSHSVYEPVEHRWGHNQYFGPPSMDGTWFKLYRNMLVREREDDVLVVLQAAPRAWLADGKEIRIERAPTYYGPVNVRVESHAASGFIEAEVELAAERCPAAVWVRFRHPDGKPMQSVAVNGAPWHDFDSPTEYVKIPRPTGGRYRIRVEY